MLYKIALVMQLLSWKTSIQSSRHLVAIRGGSPPAVDANHTFDTIDFECVFDEDDAVAAIRLIIRIIWVWFKFYTIMPVR